MLALERLEPQTYQRMSFSFGQWVIVKKIDEGGFGQVYKVENMVTKKVAALKAESNDIEGGSALKLEMTVMRTITADGEKPHVPMVFHAAKHKRFCYMIMTLLGENLKELKLNCRKEYMTAKTWTRLAIQCLYSVKLVHDYGFVHRDIKPNNFVMGYREDYERARLVHILDFGLSRSYAIQSKDGKWVARRARGTAEFRGTLRYCSPNVHEKKEQGRRDDLWSLYYVFIELHCGLPWQTLRDKQKVELLKMHMSDKDLVLNFPVELHGIVPYLRTLDYYQRPDYSMFYEGLVAVMKRVGAKASDPYDWENPDSVKNIQKHLKGPYAWENAADFFKSDPVKVNCAPPPKSRKRKYEHKVMLEQSGRKDLSDRTTASTDIDRKEVTSELTMTDVDRRLAALGVVKKAQSLDKLKEQIARKKAAEAQTPDKKDKEKDVRKTKTDESKEQQKKEETFDRKKDKKSDTAEDLLKEQKQRTKIKEKEEKKKKADGKEKIGKGTPKVRDKESKQKTAGSREKSVEETKPKKDEVMQTLPSREEEEKPKTKEDRGKTVGSKEKIEGDDEPKQKVDKRKTVGSRADKEKMGEKPKEKEDKKKEDKKKEEKKKDSASKEKIENDEGRPKQKEEEKVVATKDRTGKVETSKEKIEETQDANFKRKESKNQKEKGAAPSKEKIEDAVKRLPLGTKGNLRKQNGDKVREAEEPKSSENVDNKKKSSESTADKQLEQGPPSTVPSSATTTLTPN